MPPSLSPSGTPGQGGDARVHHRVRVGHPQGWKGHPRIRSRGPPQDGPALHLAARVRSQALPGGPALQGATR
eukprot:scaffold30980_cov39-Isochrysis_galbana.AAC.1